MNQCMTRCSAKSRWTAPNGCKHSVDKVLHSTNAWQDALQNRVAGTMCMQHFQHPMQDKMHNTTSHLSLPSPKPVQKRIQKASQAAQLTLQNCSKRCPGETKISSRSAWGTQNWGPGSQVGPKMLPRGPRWRPRGAQDVLASIQRQN